LGKSQEGIVLQTNMQTLRKKGSGALALLISLLLALYLVPVVALAAPGDAEVSIGAPTEAMPTEGYEAGAEFTVPIIIKDNPGFGSYGFAFLFDAEDLELVSFNTAPPALVNINGVMNLPNLAENTIVGMAALTAITGDGTLFWANFKVKEGASGGSSTIGIQLRGGLADNFTDLDGRILPISFQSFDITLKSPPPPPPLPTARVAVGSPEPLGAKRAGDTFTVPISIADNPGFSAASFDLNFDKDAFELTGFDMEGSPFASHLMATSIPNARIGYFGDTDTAGDGLLFKATFTVKESANAQSYPIAVILTDESPGNFVNSEAQQLDITFTGTSVVIAKAVTGFTFTVGSVSETSPGAEIRVPISVTNNPGFASALFGVKYDKDVLTPVVDSTSTGGNIWYEVETTNMIPTDSLVNFLPTKDSALDGLSFVCAVDITGDGKLLDLVFTVNSNASSGSVDIELGLFDNELGDNLTNAAGGFLTDVEFESGEVVILTTETPTADDLNYNTDDWTRTYNGSPQSVTVTPKAGIGAVTVYYNNSTTAPTDAGSYTITVDIAASGGYTAAEGVSLGTLLVNKAAAPTITWPTASTITYGQALSELALTPTTNTYGSFAWDSSIDLTAKPDAGDYAYSVVFTPNANTLKNYEAISPLEADVTVTVNKAAAPTITWPITATTIRQGQELSASILMGGSNEYGSFAWTNPTSTPDSPGGPQSVTFTASDATIKNYEPIATTVQTVNVKVILPGDVDGNNHLAALDAMLTLQAAAGLITLTDEQSMAADFNGDGAITAGDALAIVRKAFGL
jgi:hypothetical protein